MNAGSTSTRQSRSAIASTAETTQFASRGAVLSQWHLHLRRADQGAWLSWLEHLPYKEGVGGSSPSAPTRRTRHAPVPGESLAGVLVLSAWIPCGASRSASALQIRKATVATATDNPKTNNGTLEKPTRMNGEEPSTSNAYPKARHAKKDTHGQPGDCHPTPERILEASLPLRPVDTPNVQPLHAGWSLSAVVRTHGRKTDS